MTSAALGTAISVATDMTGGIIDRFRTMAISRAAVLTGHVIGSLLQTLAVLVLVVGVSLAIGFRSHASALEWLAAAGVLALFAFALIWLSAALGLAAKRVETASSTPMFLTLLPFLSSGFVPTASMPAGLRQFAEYEPLHPGHPDRPRPAHRRPRRRARDRRHRLECRHRPGQLPLGGSSLQPPPGGRAELTAWSSQAQAGRFSHSALGRPRRNSAGPWKPSTAPADLRTSVAEVGS